MITANELTQCTVCSVEFDDSTPADLTGYFGMIPVAFCTTCMCCMTDMVQQLTEQDELT